MKTIVLYRSSHSENVVGLTLIARNCLQLVAAVKHGMVRVNWALNRSVVFPAFGNTCNADIFLLWSFYVPCQMIWYCFERYPTAKALLTPIFRNLTLVW